MKRYKLDLFCHSDRENIEAGIDGIAQDVINLREVEEGLMIVGDCEKIYTLRDGERFILISKKSNKRIIITAIGRTIFINSVTVGETDGEILKATIVGSFVVISTSNGYYYLKENNSNSYAPIRIEDAIPHFRFEAVENVTISKPTAGYTIKGNYQDWKNPLNVEDIKGYTAIVREGYNNCVQEAVASGCWIQPIIVRCAVRLWDNSFLWVGAPVVVGNGYQGVDYQRVAVSFANGIVSAASYSVQSYRLGVKVDKATTKEWDSLVKGIEIYICEKSDIIMSRGDMNYRCESSVIDGERKYFLSYALPSMNNDVATSQLVNTKSWRLLTRITDYDSLRLKIINAVSTNRVSDANLGEVYSIKRNEVFQLNVSNLAWELIEHNSITPSTMMLANGRLHCGNITTRLRCDWLLPAFTGADGDSSDDGYNAVMKIKVGDSVVVWSGFINSVKLNAFIAYPDARATQIEINVLLQGKVWEWKSNLIPSISGDMAYYVSDNLTAIQLNPTERDILVIPAEENIETNVCNKLIVSMIDNPFVYQHISCVADGTILALHVAIRPVTTSIFGRYPLYAFTTNGIYALSSSKSGREYGEPRCIDSRILSRDSLIAHSLQGVYFVIANEICLLNGATVTEIIKKRNLESLAWSNVHNELWCVDNVGNVSIYIEKAKRWYNRDIFISELIGDYNNAIGITSNGVVLDLNQEIATAQHIYYRSYPIRVKGKLNFIEWHILSRSSAVELQITGDNGNSCHGDIINALRILGEIQAPIKVPLFAPAKRVVRIIIDGRGDSQMMIYPVVIE